MGSLVTLINPNSIISSSPIDKHVMEAVEKYAKVGSNYIATKRLIEVYEDFGSSPVLNAFASCVRELLNEFEVFVCQIDRHISLSSLWAELSPVMARMDVIFQLVHSLPLQPLPQSHALLDHLYKSLVNTSG